MAAAFDRHHLAVPVDDVRRRGSDLRRRRRIALAVPLLALGLGLGSALLPGEGRPPSAAAAGWAAQSVALPEDTVDGLRADCATRGAVPLGAPLFADRLKEMVVAIWPVPDGPTVCTQGLDGRPADRLHMSTAELGDPRRNGPATTLMSTVVATIDAAASTVTLEAEQLTVGRVDPGVGRVLVDSADGAVEARLQDGWFAAHVALRDVPRGPDGGFPVPEATVRAFDAEGRSLRSPERARGKPSLHDPANRGQESA